MISPERIAELWALAAAAPGKWFTEDGDGAYSGQIVRVWGDETKHWAEGFTIVTEEPPCDDHPAERAYLVAAANALPELLDALSAVREDCARIAETWGAGDSRAQANSVTCVKIARAIRAGGAK